MILLICYVLYCSSAAQFLSSHSKQRILPLSYKPMISVIFPNNSFPSSLLDSFPSYSLFQYMPSVAPFLYSLLFFYPANLFSLRISEHNDVLRSVRRHGMKLQRLLLRLRYTVVATANDRYKRHEHYVDHVQLFSKLLSNNLGTSCGMEHNYKQPSGYNRPCMAGQLGSRTQKPVI